MSSFTGAFFCLICALVVDVAKLQPCDSLIDDLDTEYRFNATVTGTVTVCPVIPAASGTASWVFIPEGGAQDTSGDYNLDTLEDLSIFACAANNFSGFENLSVLSIIIRNNSLTSGSVSVDYTSPAGQTVTLVINYDGRNAERISERTVFDLSVGSTPDIWRENGLTGLLNLCEMVGDSYEDIAIAVAVGESVSECLPGQGVVGGIQQPILFHIELISSMITADTARPYDVVLVEGSCSRPSFISDPVTLNITLPPTTPSVSPTEPTSSPTPSVPMTSTPSPTTTVTTDPPTDSTDFNVGVIIGSVVGGVIIVLVVGLFVGLFVVFLLRRRRNSFSPVAGTAPPKQRKRSSSLSEKGAPDMTRPSSASSPDLSRYVHAEGIRTATMNGKDRTDSPTVSKTKKRKKIIAYMPEQDTQWYENLGKALARKHHAELNRLLLPNATDDQWSRDITHLLTDPYCECIYCIYCGSMDDPAKSSSGFKRARSEIVSRKLLGKHKMFFVELGAKNTDQHTNGITTFFIDKPPKTEEYRVDDCAAFLHERVSSVLPTADVVTSVRSEIALSPRTQLLDADPQPSSYPLSRRLLPDHEERLLLPVLTDIRDLQKESVEHLKVIARHGERTANATEGTALSTKVQTDITLETRDLSRQIVDQSQERRESYEMHSRTADTQDQQVHGSQENENGAADQFSS